MGMMHEPYDGEVPDIAAEEIIDEGLLDEEDGAMEIISSVHHRHVGNNVGLKSQAQSTYMMEKKQKKIAGVGQNPGTKIKATRKDKGVSSLKKILNFFMGVYMILFGLFIEPSCDSLHALGQRATSYFCQEIS